MDSELTLSSRLCTAMHSVGIFSLEDLAHESGVAIEVIQALNDGDLAKVDARSLFILKPLLGSFCLRWVCLGEGPPGDLYNLSPREAAVIDGYRRLTEAGQTRVHRTVARYTPK